MKNSTRINRALAAKKKFNLIVDRVCANTPPCCSKRASRFVWVLVLMLTLGVGQMWGAVKSGWTRVTDVSEITSGGTFIFGYESSAKTNVIVPMTIKVSATPSGNGYAYSGTKTTSNTTTIDMGNNSTVTTDYEYSVVAGSANGKVCIVVMDGDYKNYYFSFSGTSNGNMRVANTKSNSTDFTPTIGSNDVVSFTNVQHNTRGLRFNTGNSPRFTNYGSTSQGGFVMYKKTSTCSKSVTLSKGTATNGTVNTISSSSVATCSSTATDRRVTVTITPAACFNAPDALTFTKSTGTVTATMQGTKTDNGDGTFSYVYQFAQDDNGSGTFGVTCTAKPAGKTVNFDAGAGTYTGGSLTEDCEGAGITLPSAVASGICKGWTTFAGWATAAVTDSTTTSGVTLYAAGEKFYPTSNGQTLYAVYSKSKGGGSSTSTLENSSIVSSGNSSGYKTYCSSGCNKTSISGWSGKFAVHYVSSGTHYAIQLGRATTSGSGAYNTHLTSPTFSNGATHISLTLSTSSSQTTSNGRKFYLMDTDELNYTATNQTSSYGVGTYDNSNSNYDVSFDITGSPTQFHIYADGTAYIKTITVTYGSSTTYYCSDPNCCQELGTINGSIKSISGTSATLKWDNLSGVDGTTPYTVTVSPNAGTTVGGISIVDGYKNCTVTGLTAGTAYTFTINAFGDASHCDASQEVAATTPKITLGSASGASSYIEGSGPGSKQTFTVTAVGLTGKLTVNAPENFAVCATENGSYTSSIDLTPTDGAVSTTVYFQLVAEKTAASSPYAGNITVSGGSATEQTVAVNGTVSPSCAAPTINNHPTGGVSYNMDVTATALTVSATKNGTGPALTYQWYSNTEDDNTSGTKIDGAESYEYTPSTDTKGTTYYYCVVSSGLCSAPSNTASITVNTPSITAGETARDFSDRKVNDGPYEMTFTVSGANLAKGQGIGLAITGTNADMFSIKDNVTSISQTSAGAVSSTTITVQYTPTSAGSHVATLTLSSKEAENKTVALSGTGKWEVVWMRNGGEYAKSLVADNTKPMFPAANPTSCDATSTTFIGWATSAWDGKLDDVNDKTIHTDNSTMSNITANGTTFHAVFAKTSGGGSGITYTLTANSTTWSSYAQKTQDDDQGLTWSMYSSKGQSGGTYYWGLNKNANGYNIESPTFPNNVSSISVNITNASARDIYICSSDDNDQPTSGDLGSASVTTHSSFTDESITLSGTSFTKFYIYVSGGVNFHSITVTTSSSSQSEYLTNCCTDLDAINGAVKENSKTATGLTLQWDNIANVTGWTVSGKDDENNDVAAANIGEPTDAGEKYECAISNLTAGKTYTFTIIPTHAPAYCSDYSNNTVTVTMPKITLSESTLTGMIYIEGAGPSAQEKSFTVTGVGLTGNLTVSAPANFQISTDNTNWGTEETITTTAGSASGTVYVRLAEGLAVGSYGSTPVYVTVSGGNASAQTVAVQGSVSPSCHTPGITGQPEGASYKLNMDATALSVTASKGDESDPTLTYQWKQCATIDGTYDNVASNGNASTYMPSTGAVGTTYYKCEVISGACSILSEAAAVTVLEPTITVSDNAVGFGDKAKGSSDELTFTVSGANLAKNEGITLTLNDETGMFSIDLTSLDATDNAVGTTTITITYAPTAVGTHNASITISSEGATSQTVNLSGTAKWTVTWNVAGTPTSNLAANGAKPTLPSAPADNALSDCSNKFMGWSAKNANDAYKTEAYYDDLFADTEHAPTISGNAEFFAVFATQTGSDAASIEFATTSDGSDDISSSLSDDNIASASGMTYAEGSKIFEGSYGIKLGSSKASGYVTCNLSSAITTKTIIVDAKDYGDNNSLYITVNGDTEFGTEQTPIEGGGELTFTVDDAIEVTSVTVETSSKRAYIKSITVGEAATTSDYITICPAVEAPTIILAAGEYCGEQSTTITAADGTTIKYTTDGSDPTNGTTYSGAITIDQSMTLKAVAIKDENVSAVTEAIYTLTFPKTVSFDAGTGTCVASMTEESCGDGIVLPSATPSTYCQAEGWTFAGWATANNTTTAPTLKAGDPYDCTEATLYAVYKKVEETYTNNYSKITSIDDLESGEDYVIAANYSNKDYALTAEEVSGYTYYMQRTEVTVADDAITSPAANLIWSITKNASDKVYLKNSDNYLYITYTGSYTNLKLASSIDNTDEEWFTPAFNALNGALTLTSQKYSTYQMIHVDGAHPEYKAATTGAQGNLYIYKHQHDVTYNSNPVCCDIEAVTNLNAAVKSATSVTLSWTTPASIANITEYKVLDASDNVLKEGIDKEATSVDVTGLTECQTYTLRVVSYSDACSVASSSVETTPSASTKTVTFDYNGGSGSVSSVSTVCGVATVALPTPDEREGYNFKGWNDGTTTYAPSTETYTPADDITLTAQWAQLFTVSYELAGGTTTTEIASATYEAGATVTLTDQVPNKGIMATFKAWSFSPEVTMTDETHFTMPSSNVTITATYNGVGEGSWILVEDASEVTVGSFIIIAAAGSNVAMGAQNTSNRGQKDITKNGNVLTYENNNVPAIFVVQAGKKDNTVAFYDGSGYIYAASSSSNDLKTKNTLDDNGSWTVTINGSAEATVTAQGTYTHNLLKKNTNSALFSCYTSGQSAIALYKFYENVPTVTYHANTDAEVTGMPNPSRSAWSDLNDRYEVTIAAGPSRYHYEFAGWYDNDSGTGEAYSGTITIADDINLYAKWTAATPHHVTYNTSGSSGTTPTDATDYYTDDEVTLASGSGLTNSGYFFDGWKVTYVDGESAVQTLTVEEGKFTMPNFDVTATATWAPKSDDKWTLVSSTGMLEVDGEYAIVCANADNGKFYAMSKTQNTNNRGVAEVEFDGDNLVGSSSMAIFTLKAGEESGQWAFYDPANTGYIYAASSTKNYLQTQEENNANGSWTIVFGENSIATITAQGTYTHNLLKYNSGSDIFSCYASGQGAVKLYKKKAVVRVENAESMNTSAISAGADVIVEAGGTLTVNADKEINDLTVKAGGEVVLNSNALTVVGTFTIKTEMASGNSGQLTGATSTNFAANGPAYIDITLGDNGNAEKWHAFTVPFPVDAINGIYDLDGNKLVNETNYAIMEYHGDIRATGAYGWKKFRGIMTPGTFYLMTVDGLRTTYRFMKTADGALVAENTMDLKEYAIEGNGEDGIDNGWNGVGNPTLRYGQVGYPVQVLNPTSYTYEPFAANAKNFIVGTPFFIQANAAAAAADMTFGAASGTANYAPARTPAYEIKDIEVSFGNEEYSDRLYISASEDALNQYETGKDLVKMTMTNTPSVAQIFGKAYNTKLCMVYAPLSNDQAVYDLTLYAPQAGEYTIAAPSMDNADLYLTYEGSIIWNLSMNEYVADFAKGNNEGYGLLLVRKAPNAATGVDEVTGDRVQCTKVVIDDHVYILRGEQIYGIDGKMVK